MTKAENEREEQLGIEPVSTLVAPLHGVPAPRLVETIEAEVRAFVGAAPAADDVTMLALARSQP